MANGDPLRAGQRVDATADTILDSYPYPSRGAAFLVRNYVFRPGAPTIPGLWPRDFIAIQGEGTTGIVGMAANSLGAGIVGVARNPGATGVYGTGGDTAVWGNGIPTALPGAPISPGADIGVIGDAVDNAGVFGLSWFGCGVLGRNQEGQRPGVRGEGDTSAGVEGVSSSAPGVFGESGSKPGVGGRSNLDAGVAGTSSDGAGVRGFSGNSVGVQGSSERTKGVEGVGPQMGVHGTSLNGQGVVGQSDRGIGVVALSRGIALRATGKTAGEFRGDVVIDGSLLVVGAKSAVVPAPGGGLQQLYCVEAPEPWFEDMGESVLVNGKAEVTLDPAYVKATAGSYQVHVTSYGPAVLWIADRRRDRFVVRAVEQAGVKASRRIAFSWRVVARRGDIKGKRFAKVQLPERISKDPIPAQPNQATDFVVSAAVKIGRKTRNPLGHAMAKRKQILNARRRKNQRKKR